MLSSSVVIDSGRLAIATPDLLGVRCFKGIPFAAPPVGPLRWKPPASVKPWTGIRPVDAFGPNSMQGVVFDDIDPFAVGVSEDCLYLNVWTPANLRGTEQLPGKLPVMFWIHGGGYVVGSGAEPRYDGSRLAARGIVVVTVNYRLNALGFLAHPELSAENQPHASGNWAMLDLVAALQWVHRNISTFGGDATAVPSPASPLGLVR